MAENSPADRVDGGRATNLDSYERWASAFGGGALLLYSLNRVSLATVLLTGVAGGLLYRGMTGYCPLTESLSHGGQGTRKLPGASAGDSGRGTRRGDRVASRQG